MEWLSGTLKSTEPSLKSFIIPVFFYAMTIKMSAVNKGLLQWASQANAVQTQPVYSPEKRSNQAKAKTPVQVDHGCVGPSKSSLNSN